MFISCHLLNNVLSVVHMFKHTSAQRFKMCFSLPDSVASSVRVKDKTEQTGRAGLGGADISTSDWLIPAVCTGHIPPWVYRVIL